MADEANDPDFTQVEAELGQIADRDATSIVDAAMKSIRRQSPLQPRSAEINRLVESLIDGLSLGLKKSLGSHETPKESTHVKALLLSVLDAIRYCTPVLADEPGPSLPNIRDEIADSVNDTLLLSVFVIVLFASEAGWQTQIDSVEDPTEDPTAVRLRIAAPCPESLRQHLEPLRKAGIVVESEPGSSATQITIPRS